MNSLSSLPAIVVALIAAPLMGALPNVASASSRVEHGQASWYSIRTNGGTHTASGQTLHDNASTAAHKTLPLGTKVRVTNLANGKQEVVTITDRGPYIAGRIIDVTIGCAERLGFVHRGVVPVRVETVGSSTATRSPATTPAKKPGLSVSKKGAVKGSSAAAKRSNQRFWRSNWIH